MEKRKPKNKHTPKTDSLLPPTLKVGQTVPTGSEKKKEKKWSLGSLLKKISSIRDYESSSNEDDIVFCKRQPMNRASLDRTDGIVLRPVHRNLQKKNLSGSFENSIRYSPESFTSQRDSRCSDGSLDCAGKKLRKNKVKARVEAKRDRLCVESSSDDDSRKSNSSLTKTQNEDCTQNGQKHNVCHRRTRTARTERYLKRFSKDDTVSVDEPILTIPHSSGRIPLKNHQAIIETKRGTSDTKESPWYSEHVDLNQNNTYRKTYHAPQGEENHYGKIRRNGVHVNALNSKASLIETSFDGPMECRTSKSVGPPTPPPRDPRCRIFTYGCYSFPNDSRHRYDLKNDVHTKKNEIIPTRMTPKMHGSNNEVAWHDRNNLNQCRPVSLNSNLFTFGSFRERENDKYNSLPRVSRTTNFKQESEASEKSLHRKQRASSSFDYDSTRFCNFQSDYNNTNIAKNYDHMPNPYRHDTAYNDTESARCQRRNDRNNRLNLTNNIINDTADYRIVSNLQSKLTPCTVSSTVEKIPSCRSNGSSDRFRMNSPQERYSRNIKTVSNNILNSVPFFNEKTNKLKSAESKPSMERNEKMKRTLNDSETMDEKMREETMDKNVKETLERRSSKNLEEALSELEAIYNSLRLGDEELLDRAEHRSMQEYSLKQGVIADEIVPSKSPDSPDRTKDDMAYRRMNPRERPSSLSDCVSNLSNISYLMTSPILTRKDDSDEHLCSSGLHRDEPDVTRDDVVFRSINYANKSLKVIEPQPPFGIPLGPVTTAAESDYLHTTPKLDQPRSPYQSAIEPDVVTDDLAYRALRKDAGATKGSMKYQQDPSRSPVPSSRTSSSLGMIDQQPSFGIPIGPVVSAPETDYLHVSPSKPDAPRSPYLPQSQPDLVTDDLAYRSLRKDVGLPNNNSKDNNVWSRSPNTTFATKKKRAVRSLSANLYGLINQDRIHLHRQPSLSEIEDEFKDEVVNYALNIAYPEYLRRVVSDGELSDQDYRWRTRNKLEKSIKDVKRNLDINSNKSAYVCKKKLQVYVSPSDTQDSGKDRESDSSVSTSTLTGNLLTTKTFGDEFWHDRQRSNVSPSSRNSPKSVESDLTTYTRLCQDLTDLIKWPEETEKFTKEDSSIKVEKCKQMQESKINNDSIQPSKINEKAEDDSMKNDQMKQEKILSSETLEKDDDKSSVNNDAIESKILHIESLGSHYTKLNDDSIESIEEDSSKKAEEDSLDYYLRLADENVKLLAEAFSDVMGCLSDTQFYQSNSSDKNIESEESINLKKENEADAVDTQKDENIVFHEANEFAAPPKEELSAYADKDQTNNKLNCDDNSILNAEINLSQAVHDLQTAAASLCAGDRMTEEEKVETSVANNSADDSVIKRTEKDVTEDTQCCEEDTKLTSLLYGTSDETVETLSPTENTDLNCLKCEIKEDVETHATSSTDYNESSTYDTEKETDETSSADGKTMSVEDLNSDQEKDIKVPSSVEERIVKRGSLVSGEGENTECEFHAKIHAFDGAGSKEMCVFCVTNLSATAYTIILLACFIALLLAIIVAS